MLMRLKPRKAPCWCYGPLLALRPPAGATDPCWCYGPLLMLRTPAGARTMHAALAAVISGVCRACDAQCGTTHRD